MPKTKKQDKISHISRIVFEGYKSIDHLEIDLVKRLNIIIGPNGSGKSNFLELLDFIFHAKESIYFHNQNNQSYNLSEIVMSTAGNNKIKWYTERKPELLGDLKKIFADEDTSDKGLIFSWEKIVDDNKVVFDSRKWEEQGASEKQNFKMYGVINFHLFVKTMYLPSIVFIKYNLPEYFTSIEKFGTITIEKRNKSVKSTETDIHLLKSVYDDIINNLGSYFLLQENKLNKQKILEKLQFPEAVIRDLKTFSPIQDVRFSPNINLYEDENRASIENIILEFYVNDSWVPWSYLSDGTKRLFYLISEISYFQDAIILIEEPELGVHPDQFFSIMTFLKEQAEYRQIIISTHSAMALNSLNENELGNIILTKYDKKKGTTMTHLNKEQESKAKLYIKDVGFLSDYWLHSDMEE